MLSLQTSTNAEVIYSKGVFNISKICFLFKPINHIVKKYVTFSIQNIKKFGKGIEKPRILVICMAIDGMVESRTHMLHQL